MDTKEEREFLERLHGKRPTAFKELFLAFYSALVYFGMRCGVSKEEAEDFVQDVFAEVWESGRRYGSYSGLKTYLYTSVRNACVNRVKRREVEERYAQYVAEHGSGEDESSDERIMEEEVYRLLVKAVGELPPRCREVFEWALQGKRNEEIAEVLKVSVLTVKAQKRIGLKLLRDKLGKLYVVALLLLEA